LKRRCSIKLSNRILIDYYIFVLEGKETLFKHNFSVLSDS